MKLGTMAARAERRDEAPFRPGRGDEGRDLDRQRADAGGEKQRQQELGPGEDEAEHGRRGDAAAHHRQHDPREDLQAVAPSIIAASSTSCGTSSKKDFISSTAIGRLIRVWIRIRPRWVSRRPRSWNMKNDRHDDGDRRHEALRQHPVEKGLLRRRSASATGHRRRAWQGPGSATVEPTATIRLSRIEGANRRTAPPPAVPPTP